MVYGTIVEVFLQKLSQWYCDASPEAPSPEYTGSGDYRSSAPGGSAQGPSSHLTVADHRRPDAVSCPKRVVFRYGGPVFFGVVPERGGFSGTVQTPLCTAVPKCPVRRRIPAEVWKGSVQFCRTSTVIGVVWQKSTEVRKE